MKKHVKIYMDFFNYDISDFIPCEVCGAKAVDIHHINAKGRGGNPKGDKDVIENLQALCRKHHTEMGDKKEWKDWLKKLHKIKMESR